jgi:ectoine hydroxylase-related dioxygenase (phytanoyl-CoA dioxygenase family)
MNEIVQAVSERESPAPQRLSHDEREAFRRGYDENGYYIFRNLVPGDALSALRGRLSEAFERAEREGGLFAGGGRISGHLNCFPGAESRFAYEAIERRGIVDLVRACLPGLQGTLRVGCNFNLPNSVPQHYHVDSQFLDEFVVVNVAVVDTDLVNGAIDVLPGTHKQFYRYWQFAARRLNRLTTRLPLKRGDVLVRSSNLWHRGMPNRSAAPRPMLAFTFGDGERRAKPGPAADPFQVDAGKITFHPNWYRPNLAGRLRERTFVAVPITYATYRFVRSLFGTKGYGTL